jgi:tetratricopeptide (TPR) repeat protein
MPNQHGVPSPFSISAINYYYEAMELLQSEDMGGAIRALQILEQGYKLEPDLIDLQLGYIEAYNTLGIHASVAAHIEQAYAMVRDAFPRWPKRLEWGEVENRGYLRALQAKADWEWEYGAAEDARTIYEQILKLNPHDNQGVRYCIAAIYADLRGQDLDALWAQANEKQDFSGPEKLLVVQNKKYHFWVSPLEEDV